MLQGTRQRSVSTEDLPAKGLYSGAVRYREIHFMRFCMGGGLQNNKVLSFPFLIYQPEAEFKEFESRLKFETHLKYCWFRLKLYSMFQDLGRCSIETGFWLYFQMRLKFLKFLLILTQMRNKTCIYSRFLQEFIIKGVSK